MLDGGTDSVGDKEGLPDGEPDNELVLVRNRLDSELHGLGDGEKESDGEAEVERLPDDDEVVVILDLAVCVFVGWSETDKVDVPVRVESDDWVAEVELSPVVVAVIVSVRVPSADLEPVAVIVLVLETEEEPDTVAVFTIVLVKKLEVVKVLEPVLVLETEILPVFVGLDVGFFDCIADKL